MKHIADFCDRVNALIGSATQWLSLIMVLVQFLVVILRYVFGIGSIQLQESVIYMHALLFLCSAASSWQEDAHVRVDIFYARMTAGRKSLINMAGAILFVLPLCALILYVSFDYVAMSWAVREGSRETSGIQAIFLLKTLILVFAVQLALQALALILRRGTMGVDHGAS
jgi:TRAP-type mannitol/chloroaromatic compound transport system permease small subunit